MNAVATFIALLLLSAWLPCSADPADWLNRPIPKLILANGKEYSDVTITEISADSIAIKHAGGIGRIPMEALKPESQQALGYDPAKAGEARAAAAEARAAAMARAADAAMLSRFEERFDEFQNRIFYHHVASTGVAKTGLGAYISAAPDAPADSVMFLIVRYRGEDWIFMDSIIFAGGPEPLRLQFDAETDVPGGGALLHEWAHVPIRDPGAFLAALARFTSFRLAGKFAQDYDITADERLALVETALLFEKLRAGSGR